MSEPSLYDFHDFRAWLAAWYGWMTEVGEPGLTKSEVSRRLGLPRTRSYFTDILRGRVVSPVFVERLVDLTELNRTEAKYFRALVRFDQARDPREREEAFEDLLSHNRVPWARAAGESWEYYSDWKNQLVRGLLLLRPVAGEGAELARLSLPSLTPAEIRRALANLARLGMIEKGADGKWLPATPTLSTGTGLADDILRQAQIVQIGHLRDELAHPPAGRPGRKVTTSVVAISGKGAERLMRRLERLRTEIRSLAHRDPDPADRLYLVTLAAIPLSRLEKP